ncbi:MAG: hypothetical protein R3A48_07885 [Polyangiales bacterium]
MVTDLTPLVDAMGSAETPARLAVARAELLDALDGSLSLDSADARAALAQSMLWAVESIECSGDAEPDEDEAWELATSRGWMLSEAMAYADARAWVAARHDELAAREGVRLRVEAAGLALRCETVEGERWTFRARPCLCDAGVDAIMVPVTEATHAVARLDEGDSALPAALAHLTSVRVLAHAAAASPHCSALLSIVVEGALSRLKSEARGPRR